MQEYSGFTTWLLLEMDNSLEELNPLALSSAFFFCITISRKYVLLKEFDKNIGIILLGGDNFYTFGLIVYGC